MRWAATLLSLVVADAVLPGTEQRTGDGATDDDFVSDIKQAACCGSASNTAGGHNVLAPQHMDPPYMDNRAKDHTSWKNIAMVKVPKTGSSTFAGVLHRVGSRNGLSGSDDCLHTWGKEPLLWAEHESYHMLKEHLDRLGKTYLVTIVRDPLDRCFSHYYYSGKSNSATAKKHYMRDRCDNFQAKSIAETRLKHNTNITAETLLEDYDMVAVADRFDQSVVMMAHQLGVSLDDVAYVSVKIAGEGNGKGTKNTHPPFHAEPKAVKKYASSAEWRQINNLDYAILEKANADLDAFYASEGNRKKLAEFVELREKLEADLFNKTTGEFDQDQAYADYLMLYCPKAKRDGHNELIRKIRGPR